MQKKKNISPWAWVPSLYFAQGIPYVIVMTVAVIMYKRLGISNTDIALYTSWLYLPWVIKPLWSPLVDLLKTKRWWIVTMQLIVGAGLAGVAFTIPAPSFFQYTLAFLWLLAFSSATHDIAADGFYMLGLDKGEQAYFIGIRSTFYRIAMITGQGILIIIAGFFETQTGLEPVKFSVQTHTRIEVTDGRPTAGADSIYVISNNETNFTTPDNTDKQNIQSNKHGALGLNFILEADEFFLSTQLLDIDIADSLKLMASGQNIANGFVIPEPEKIAEKPSWFAQLVSNPLKNTLKKWFQKDAEAIEEFSKQSGNLMLIGIKLSEQPEKPVILNTNFSRGDKSLKLIEGERLEFNAENWNKTAWLVVQADSKLDKAVAAWFEGRSGNIPLAWSITFFGLTGLFLLFFLYHRIFLPRPGSDMAVSSGEGQNMLREFGETFVSFFKKKEIGLAIAFMLLFRLGEAQLVKLATPFLIDTRESGGLGLTTGDVGLVYGTIGVIALTLGGILGGLLASRKGLKYWIFPMTMAINVPNLVYVYLSYFTPENLWIISSAVAIEQFGYGFGFTAFMLYLIYFSEGKNKTAHYAICTGLMALGMMIPGMFSGWLQEIIGYGNFFIWVVLCTIPGFIIVRYLKIDPKFGIKETKRA